jgi:telomere length regulation protein
LLLDDLSSLTHLFTKLVNTGLFPASRPFSPSQPSFFYHALDILRERISNGGPQAIHYSALWSDLISSIPSTLTVQSVLTSLFGHLEVPALALDGSMRSRALVKREAELVHGLVGEYSSGNMNAVIIGRDWSEGYARIFTCWVAGAGKTPVNDHGLC